MTTDLEKTNGAWLDELTLELRLRDVSGSDIGDAVASAREFLVDAGTPAEESFGPAAEYAAALDLTPAPDASTALRRALVGGLASLLGFFAVVFASPSVIRHDELDVSVSALVLIAMGAILLAATPVWLRHLARMRGWKIAVVAAALLLIQLVLAALFGGVVVATVPALPVMVVGGALLLGTAVWTQLRAPAAPDPVTDPREPRPASVGNRLSEVLPVWLLVVMAGVFVAIDVLLLGG